ncbi:MULTISPECIES: hypothetical protein [unclassified Acinetobacter]|uniref:hypothetical protein n=1 Tax=unclassified Acinetobacter TaxID=196816 RepID=UPI0015D1E71A|nr:MULTISPECIES: hypothetical protein [unclassified Acinetobacter]
MKYLILALLVVSPMGFTKDIYTCTVNGKTIYQGKPCPNTGKTVGQILKEKEALEQKQYEEQQRIKTANQASVSKSESVTMDFTKCKQRVLAAQLNVAPHYKTSVIVNAPKNYVARICTNDGSVLMTCSGQDNKLITVKSSYCS